MWPSWIMAKTDAPPLAFGEIIDHIEQMREELLMLQRSPEKMEFGTLLTKPGDNTHRPDL
jgi:hypothetical protein